MENGICTIAPDIGCPHVNEVTRICEINNRHCSFWQEKEQEKPGNHYVRKERWYERYYKKSRPAR